jgi:hypothetical protein
MNRKILIWEGRQVAELHNQKWHFIGDVPLIEQSCAFKYGEVIEVKEPDLVIERELEDQIDLSPLLLICIILAVLFGLLSHVMGGAL